jgi:hypothetical protein
MTLRLFSKKRYLVFFQGITGSNAVGSGEAKLCSFEEQVE